MVSPNAGLGKEDKVLYPVAGDTPTLNVMEIGAFSLCYFYRSFEWSPMGQKGTGPKFVTRPVGMSS